jgi:cytidylate kinase
VTSQSSNLGHLINRQVSLWESKQGVQAEARPSVRGTPGHPAEGPWITISTQLGAGGEELAAGLGARLGWQVFDKQILGEIAKSTNTREKVLSRLDDHAVGTFEDYVSHLFVPGDLGHPAFVREMMKVVWAIARQGEAIMLGRGANWLLDPRYGVRVRAIAPVERRAQWITRTQAMSDADAIRRAEEDSADRARFMRQVYKQDIDNPLGYDLVINLGTVDLQPAVELVAAALASKLVAAA